MNGIVNVVWKPLCTTRLVRVDRAFFSETARHQIEQLSCRDPETVGWHVTHWSQRSLAHAAVEQGYVASIDPTAVEDILREADLCPHDWRDWKTTVWDDEAVARALKIL